MSNDLFDVGEPTPLTQVYDGVWKLLEDRSMFRDLIKKGNRIKFAGKARMPIKSDISTEDTPELRIIPAGTEPHLEQSSNGSRITEQFDIILTTGDMRTDAVLYPVKWEIFRAFSDWATTLKDLTYKGKKFVVLARLLTTVDGISETDLARGIKGWTTVWRLAVDMWFETSVMRLET